ncbi:MAG: DUF2723 domain-containing protein [Chloroflexota bacterium]
MWSIAQVEIFAPLSQIRQFGSFPLKWQAMAQPNLPPKPNKPTGDTPPTSPAAPRSSLHALRSTPLGLFVLVFIAVLTLYTVTLAPGVVGGDAGEHQFTAPLLGIPHTTGYPLYILLGKLWTLLLPFGSIAWRMNLFSAWGGALAAAITSLTVYRLTRPASWTGALVAGLTLACGLTLWQWSIIAGVRSFNVLFFALLTLEAILWQQQRQGGDAPAAERTLRWLALTVGLSLAHHRTTIFYLPSLIGWIGWHEPQLWLRPKRLLTLAALTLAPLSLYAFIYFRGVNNPPYTHERITDLSSFWFLVGSGDSAGLFLSIDPIFLPARLAFLGRDLLAQLSWPGLLLAGLGGLRLLWRQPRHFVFQGVLIGLLLWFTLDFEVVNPNEAPAWYLMPAYFILVVWVGVGIDELWLLLAARAPLSAPRLSFAGQLLTTLAAVALLGYSLAWPNWQHIYADSTGPLDEWRQLLRGDQARRFVESSLPYVEPGSLILGDWEQFTPYKYYQLINGRRTDVTPRLPLDRWPEQVAAAHVAGQPVYFARKTADLIGVPHLSMVGPLIHLRTAPLRQAPDGIIRLNVNFEDELELMGYRAEVIPQSTPGGQQAGPILQLMFYWRAPRKPAWDYALSLRLVDPAGQEIYRRDAAHPVLSSYPTSLWIPGEVVGDFYELPLPPGAGPLTLHLLPYRTEGPGQWHNLTRNGTEPPQAGILLGPFAEM